MKEHREIQTLIDQLEAYIKKQDEAIKALQKTNQYLVAQLLQAPAQFERKWVGLTDDEIKKIMQQALTVLKEWDALIKHQYSGSSEAMTDMQYAAWHTVDVIKDIEALQNALTQPEHLDLRKAAKMALEALENFCEYGAIQQPIEKRDAVDAARLDEREACAKLCDDMGNKQTNQCLYDPWDCASSIRARGNHEQD